MTIRWNCADKGCYVHECLPDWGFLRGAFVRGCTPSDIDGMVEIDGRFLYLEEKSIIDGRLVEVQVSQRIAARRRIQDGISTYLFIWRDTEYRHLMAWDKTLESVIVDATAESIHQFCQHWSKGISVEDHFRMSKAA